MIKQLDYLERTILETWGGSLNDLEQTPYWQLLDVLSAKEPKEQKEDFDAKNIPSAFEFFQKHSINDI